MSHDSWADRLAGLERQPGADSVTLRRLQEAVGLPLPDSYVQLLQASNGGEWWIGENFIRLRGATDLTDDPFPFAEFVPGVLFFAGDGGAALFGFDLREGSGRVLVLHTDDLQPKHAIELGENLEAFFDLLRTKDWIDVWQERYSRIGES